MEYTMSIRIKAGSPNSKYECIPIDILIKYLVENNLDPQNNVPKIFKFITMA